MHVFEDEDHRLLLGNGLQQIEESAECLLL
jgi:hypothetical protein